MTNQIDCLLVNSATTLSEISQLAIGDYSQDTRVMTTEDFEMEVERAWRFLINRSNSILIFNQNHLVYSAKESGMS